MNVYICMVHWFQEGFSVDGVYLEEETAKKHTWTTSTGDAYTIEMYNCQQGKAALHIGHIDMDDQKIEERAGLS